MGKELSLQERFAPRNACFGCGPANERGLRIRSFPTGSSPDSVVVAEWTPETHHEAFHNVLNGGIIGIAWLSVICDSLVSGLGFSVVQDFGGLICRTDLSAHELGHNWSAVHCDPCGTTMRSFIGCFNQFGSLSIGSISSHRNSRNEDRLPVQGMAKQKDADGHHAQPVR